MLDSDSSQTRAITEALSGRNLVIKGPPGTGKSQTITNLIASAIASGQRVLFVAEKRAAIEAVTKRLGQVGLGGLVLDLHSGAESKRWFAQQLGDSLEAIRASRSVSVDAARSRAERARDSWTHMSQRSTARLNPWQKSLFDAEVAAMELGPPVLAARIAPSDLERLRETISLQLRINSEISRRMAPCDSMRPIHRGVAMMSPGPSRQVRSMTR